MSPGAPRLPSMGPTCSLFHDPGPLAHPNTFREQEGGAVGKEPRERGVAWPRSSGKPRPGIQTSGRARDPRLTRALPVGPRSLSAQAPASSPGRSPAATGQAP